ncbi:AraC family transcriptional regulator [Noviherbaspirillum malthae]|jgi:AraC-like DNA-binding protein|uniref:AraC family transcriptional regulator n=1 Tax=Noviherbaspirillum malthae TaxID=1260987 RepID=UPI00188E739D|nr:AraC family transcriptional regulator [Noviherbaspirillum malthae]
MTRQDKNSKHGPRQIFWRDPDMPFIEARMMRDGAEASYARHWHDTFSVGIITGGRSSYVNGAHSEEVGQGMLVVMNPGDVHVCNPLDDAGWSFIMFYIDAEWMGRVQADLRGSDDVAFRPYARAALHAPHLADAGVSLFSQLTDADSDRLIREVGIIEFAGLLDGELTPCAPAGMESVSKAERAARHIDAHFSQSLRLEELCAVADLSASYLIRAFKKRYGVAPHEYQTNRRIQFGKARLREGVPIAQAALEAGFADQAHFQRIFKRLTAATPGQYQSRP